MIGIPLADPDIRERYSKELAIIIPYRNRWDHLVKIIPHLYKYFEMDKLDRRISKTVHVVEQAGHDPFNRGRLCNAGFKLVRDECDYVCVHDVDYLPMWADYSWGPEPARLIWLGLICPENPETFFGAVVLLDNNVFERVNGFPNCYWGWGPEDFELGYRCKVNGYAMDRRDGAYLAIPHKHAGILTPTQYTEEGRRTNNLFKTREGRLDELMKTDGLANVEYKLLEKKPFTLNGEEFPGCWHYLVDIGGPEPGAV